MKTPPLPISQIEKSAPYEISNLQNTPDAKRKMKTLHWYIRMNHFRLFIFALAKQAINLFPAAQNLSGRFLPPPPPHGPYRYLHVEFIRARDKTEIRLSFFAAMLHNFRSKLERPRYKLRRVASKAAIFYLRTYTYLDVCSLYTFYGLLIKNISIICDLQRLIEINWWLLTEMRR